MNAPRLRLLLRRGLIWALAGRVAALGSGMAVTVLLARVLSHSHLGAYFVVLALVGVGQVPACFGLDSLVVRLVAAHGGRRDYGALRACVRSVAKTAVITVGLSSVAFYVLATFLVPKLTALQSTIEVVALCSGLLALESFNRLTSECFRGLHDIRLAAMFGGVVKNVGILTLLGVTHTIGSRPGLVGVLCIITSASGVSVVLGTVLLTRRLRSMPSHQSAESRLLFVEAAPYMATSGALTALSQADVWILSVFVPDAQIALYGAVVRLVALVSFPIVVVNAVLPPIVSELFAADKKQQLQEMLRKTAAFTTLPVLLGVPVVVLNAAGLLDTVYGAGFGDAAPLLIVFSLAQLINVWVGSCGMALQMTNGARPMMWNTLILTAASMLLALVLVPPLGTLGAALAFGSGKAVQNLVALLLARRTVGVWTHADFRAALPLRWRGAAR